MGRCPSGLRNPIWDRVPLLTQGSHVRIVSCPPYCGGVRLLAKAVVLKTTDRFSGTWVRIPPPPDNHIIRQMLQHLSTLDSTEATV